MFGGNRCVTDFAIDVVLNDSSITGFEGISKLFNVSKLMNYDEQNADIKKRISEIELKIMYLQDLYHKAPSVYYYYSAIQRKINSEISFLERQKEDLINKLKESPRQRRWSNLKDKGDDFVLRVLNSLPEFPEHVSGRIYRDTNDGCFKWCLILFVLSAIVSAIVITIEGEWDIFF